MKQLFIPILLLFIIGCGQKEKPDIEQLFEVDRRFSNSASTNGFNNAFIEFAHPDAVLLRPNKLPIKGKIAIISFYEKLEANGIDFSWEPEGGDIAVSGELGYTYGIYTIKVDTITEKGTYISVWKKDEAGNWKYVLDTGNEGIGD
ncbi:MAG: nuclear transport factor 2 family protein [Draconibacterium sp.]